MNWPVLTCPFSAYTRSSPAPSSLATLDSALARVNTRRKLSVAPPVHMEKPVASFRAQYAPDVLGSDASLENTASHRFHGGSGFEETGRVVYFRKVL